MNLIDRITLSWNEDDLKLMRDALYHFVFKKGEEFYRGVHATNLRKDIDKLLALIEFSAQVKRCIVFDERRVPLIQDLMKPLKECLTDAEYQYLLQYWCPSTRSLPSEHRLAHICDDIDSVSEEITAKRRCA